MMDMKAGARFGSVTDSTEVVIVRAPNASVDLRCGGHAMVPFGSDSSPQVALLSGFDDGTQVGKRYVDEASGLEVLCTKAGPGTLSLGVDPLPMKSAKLLPSSD